MTKRPLSIFVSHPSPFVTDSWPHGDGLIAYAILRRLADRGHVLHVAMPLSGLTKPMPENVKLYPLKTRVAPTKDHPGLAYRAEYAVRVRSLFTKVSQENKIDLIHQMNPVVGGLSLLLYGLGYPLLMGPIWPLWKGRGDHAAANDRNLRAVIKDALLTPQFLRLDGILSPTPASAARLPKSVRHSDRSFPFYVGVDVDEFSPDNSPRTIDPTILFLANMQERKGVFTLLSAFDRLQKKLPSARLILAGDGEQFEEVRRRVARSPGADRIELRGHVTREDVPRTLRACSVYCLPSFGEPYGMSALEAMACGKPLVVTNAGGLGHLVPDQGSLKVVPGDPAALAGALFEILKNETLQQEMGRFNRNYVKSYHSWNQVIADLEDIYVELINRSSGGRLQSLEDRRELAS